MTLVSLPPEAFTATGSVISTLPFPLGLTVICAGGSGVGVGVGGGSGEGVVEAVGSAAFGDEPGNWQPVATTAIPAQASAIRPSGPIRRVRPGRDDD